MDMFVYLLCRYPRTVSLVGGAAILGVVGSMAASFTALPLWLRLAPLVYLTYGVAKMLRRTWPLADRAWLLAHIDENPRRYLRLMADSKRKILTMALDASADTDYCAFRLLYRHPKYEMVGAHLGPKHLVCTLFERGIVLPDARSGATPKKLAIVYTIHRSLPLVERQIDYIEPNGSGSVTWNTSEDAGGLIDLSLDINASTVPLAELEELHEALRAATS